MRVNCTITKSVWHVNMPAVIGTEPIPLQEFEQLLHALQAASKLPTKSRTHQVSPLVSTICGFGYQNGFQAPALAAIVDIVTSPSHLDQSNLTTLVKGLYPVSKVSSDIICTIVSALGPGKQKPSATTQNALLRWVILVYEFIEDATILSKLYGVLFNLLDMISIRSNLCYILSLITRRKHIKSFRINFLLELSRRFGNEPTLLGLVKIYKEYYPDMILEQSIDGKISRFECPDSEWRERLLFIQNTKVRSFEVTAVPATGFKVVRRGLKRARTAIVPEVVTFRADESSTTFEEINDVFDFVEKLDKVTLPNQMVSALDDPLLRKYVVLRGTSIPAHRVDDWLLLFFDTQLQFENHSEGISKPLVEVLDKVLSYAHYTKDLPSSVRSFLAVFLEQWDGKDHRDLILALLQYLPLSDFEGLQITLLSKLEAALLDNNPESSTILLEYYTSLLRHWTARLLSLSQPSTDSSASSSTISALTTHASLLALSLLASQPPTQTTISAILSYHESFAQTISHAPTSPQIRILAPLSHTIYLLVFFHPSLSNLSRVCSVLAIYKRAFETAMSKPPPGATHQYPKDYVNHFNGVLMDICNLLWRSRAFNTSDINALGCFMPPSTVLPLRTYADALIPPQVLQSMFSLSHNPVLSAVSRVAFRELEERMVDGEMGRTRHAGPVTQKSLEALAMDGGIRVGWADYRLEVLRWLGKRGVEGVEELMFCTMKQLMTGKGARG